MVDGNRIKNLRKKYKITAKELAESLDVTIGVVFSWQRNDYSPSKEVLPILAKTLKTSQAYLLGETDEPSLYASAQNTHEPTAGTNDINFAILRSLDTFASAQKETIRILLDISNAVKESAAITHKIGDSNRMIIERIDNGIANIGNSLKTVARDQAALTQTVSTQAHRYDNVIDFKPYFRSPLAEQRGKLFPHRHEHWLRCVGAGAEKTRGPDDDDIQIRVSMVPEKTKFSVTVHGPSMEPLIRDGTIIHCNSITASEVHHNDLVIFVDEMQEEYKLRRARTSSTHYGINNYTLYAVNPDYEDYSLLDENIRVIGVVVYTDNQPEEEVPPEDIRAVGGGQVINP